MRTATRRRTAARRPMARARRTDLCVVAHGGRQQGEGVVNGDAPLDDVLAEPLQAVLAVGRGQIQQPWWWRQEGGERLYSINTAIGEGVCVWF